MHIFQSTLNTRPILEDNLKYIRSDVPTKISEEEKNWLLSNNVTTIIDLRTDEERARKHCPLMDDERFAYHVFTMTGGDKVPPNTDAVSGSYIGMVDANFHDMIGFLLKVESNVLYFCNAGKDRTGVVSAVLLHHLGMSEQYIVDDYLKSKENLKTMLDEYARQNPEIDIDVITPQERYIEEFLRWYIDSGRSEASAVSVIGRADGPTSVFLLNRNAKLTLRQKIERFKYKIRRNHVEKTLKPESHTIEEVMEYIVNVHGFVPLEKDSDETREEYNQLRASFLIRFAPELLGEYAEMPTLKDESEEAVRAHLQQLQDRINKAQEIPVTEFDIDFHKFVKSFNDKDANDNIHIDIEKKYSHIGGGAVGNKKVMKKFHQIYKDIYRYYGVTEEDIRIKSARYRDVVQALSG